MMVELYKCGEKIGTLFGVESHAYRREDDSVVFYSGDRVVFTMTGGFFRIV